MYEKILIPYDGSEESKKGAEIGLDLAAELGSVVHALYVVELPGAPRSVYLRDDEEEMRERYQEYGEKVTSELCTEAAARDIECVTAIKSGNAAEEIVEYAEKNGVDSIFMGSAYKGTLGGLLGSTTDKVVRTATVPVTTHRMQMDE